VEAAITPANRKGQSWEGNLAICSPGTGSPRIKPHISHQEFVTIAFEVTLDTKKARDRLVTIPWSQWMMGCPS
jgi:hypothetical protein